MKKNIATDLLFIHGGMTFRKYSDYIEFLKNKTIDLDKPEKWSDNLEKSLPKNIRFIKPRMPCKENAKYEERKIHFENHLEHLNEQVILVGKSLGGIFLAKYLAEHKFPKILLSVYLIAPPFDDTIAGEDLVGRFELPKDLSMVEQNCKNSTLLFSKDDDVVPISHADKYRLKLPNVYIKAYNDKNGHFQVSEFPEIVDMIKNDVGK